MTPDRPRRSVLFLPASNPRAVAKAATLDADVLVLDLEDAVAPSAKAEARAAAVAAAHRGFPGRELVVRCNTIASPWGKDDLAALAEAPVDAVLVPKLTGAEEIDRYDEQLRGKPLWAMIETCRAVSRLSAITDRAADTGLAALVVGANDLVLEMRARPGPDRAGLMPILAMTVAAARASGLAVIDAVCNDFHDLARVAAECAQGRAIGFDGKSVIHPAQIASANAAFGPDPDEVAEAKAIVAAFTAEPQGGVAALDGRMIERLHLEGARRTLALAAAITAGRRKAGPG